MTDSTLPGEPLWYLLTDTFEREGKVVAGPFTTQADAKVARIAIERLTGNTSYWVDSSTARYSVK